MLYYFSVDFLLNKTIPAPLNTAIIANKVIAVLSPVCTLSSVLSFTTFSLSTSPLLSLLSLFPLLISPSVVSPAMSFESIQLSPFESTKSLISVSLYAKA